MGRKREARMLGSNARICWARDGENHGEGTQGNACLLGGPEPPARRQRPIWRPRSAMPCLGCAAPEFRAYGPRVCSGGRAHARTAQYKRGLQSSLASSRSQPNLRGQKIFRGGKTWEIRGGRCHHRGRVYIAESGSSSLVGHVGIADCLAVGALRNGQLAPAAPHRPQRCRTSAPRKIFCACAGLLRAQLFWLSASSLV